MQLVALVKSPDHVCCRYRVAAFRPFLEAAGHQLTLKGWPANWLSRLSWRRHLGSADAVIVQRRLPPAWQLALLRRATGHLLFDFDDAIFLRDSYSPKRGPSTSRARGFAAMVRAADAVIAGNSFLHEHAALWTAPERVHLIKTCLDVGRYPLAAHRRSLKHIQLAWIGSSSTLRGLERIGPLLDRLGRRLPELTLKVICDRFPRLRDLPVRECPWNERDEARELAAADIGISWLPDDLWSRGKCTLKVLQYMAAGLPVIANPVGVHGHLVEHGRTGFLVTTPQQWVEAVRHLAADPALRRRMGEAGRRRVEAEFDVPVGAAGWISLLDRMSGAAAAVLPHSNAEPHGTTIHR